MPAALTVQLLGVTQALAAARTQTEVLDVVLNPSIHTLGAIAGAVLLVDEHNQHLRMARHLGVVAGTPTIWQDGPLGAEVPAADVLRTRTALYFEDAGALIAAYPELETLTGGVAAVATAVLPMFLDGRPLGSLVLDFKEPHTFTADEQYFLRTLAAQCAIALDRARSLRVLGQHLEERNRKILEDAHAHEAFVAFTEAVGNETELAALVRQAITVLEARFPGASVVYYEEEEDGLWKAQSWSDDLSPEQTAPLAAGLPAETPLLAHVLHTRQPVFTDAEHTQQEEGAVADGAVANYPLTVNGELRWLLSVRLRGILRWNEVDRRLVQAVGHSLNLVLERTQRARQLMLQNAEFQARTRALEAFADLTRDLALTTDPLLLIRRAQEVVLSMLSDGAALYMVPDADRWYCRVQHGTLHSPELQAAVDAGLPGTSNLLIPWTTGQPYFQDVYDRANAQLPSLVRHVSASVTLPLRVEGQLTGILAFVLFDQRHWSSVDRVLLETAVQSLELALDRAVQTQHLVEEQAALEMFARFTELVGSETQVQELVGQATALLADTCSVDVIYCQRAGELFKVSAWNPLCDPELLVALQHGFPLRHSNIGQLLQQNTAAFIDHWRETPLLIPASGIFQALAGYPYFEDGVLEQVLLMGSRTSATWTQRDQGIFRAVGRSLNLALNRAQQAQLLRTQRDALATRTQELSNATQELEIFSYSVAHDLRTPVRHMLGFLQLARKTLDGRLDERSARYLDVVAQAGTQMNALIDGLLELSRTAQQPLRRTTVDLNSVMRRIQQTLTPDLLSRNIQWDVASLPAVQGDAAALTQVLTQFTENALKFTQTRDPAVIRVYAADQGDAWGVFVQDNGLGFDPRYQERLFNLFQRLHTAQEATGTGVGLASVRRLILKHGGQVFAEGQVGQGATFGFSLPKEDRLSSQE